MGQHLRAKLGPAGRVELARLQLDEGLTERAAAAALSVASGTARRWKLRRLAATEAELASGAWALGRSSRPRSCPRQTPADVERRVCDARERTGWGPRLLVAETGVAHSTISAILRRHGCSRAPRPARREVCRYEWPCPCAGISCDPSGLAFACHAEGRGFESLQPLLLEALLPAGFLRSGEWFRRLPRVRAGRSLEPDPHRRVLRAREPAGARVWARRGRADHLRG